jgi:hypothetical protein
MFSRCAGIELLILVFFWRRPWRGLRREWDDGDEIVKGTWVTGYAMPMSVKQKTLTWAASVAVVMAMTVALRGAVTKADAPNRRPNILIILADDLGFSSSTMRRDAAPRGRLS